MSAVQSRSERAEAQRERILQAAQKCFTEHGFHGASMAAIADTAQMSPGLIYRYFDGKSAIIQGIVERQLEWMAQELADGRLFAQDPADVFSEHYSGEAFRERGVPLFEPALFLEIVAESSRDANVAAALQKFDCAMDEAAEDWLLGKDARSKASATELAARTFAIRCFIEGLKVRQLREPDVDPQVLRQALSETFRCLRVA